MIVNISVPVYPSEDPEKVRGAVLGIFPDVSLTGTDDAMHGTTDNMDSFMTQIRRQKMLDSVRAVMIRGRIGNVIAFRINKQAATAGKISFAEERAVLGSIEVTVKDDMIQETIDKVAPATVDGEEIK